MKSLIDFFSDLLIKILGFLKIPEDKAEQIVQFVQFCIVGLSNTLISYAVYMLFLAFDQHYLVGSVVGFIVSVINSYYWNNKYVFKAEDGQKRPVLSTFIKTFLSYASTGLVLSNILLILWIEFLHLPEWSGPILNLLVTIPLNFILNKLWAYRSK